MILISMTSHISDIEEYVVESKSKERGFDLIVSYKNFIEQPIKIEMITPCYDNGVIMEYPDLTFSVVLNDHRMDRYIKARKKVLFKGFNRKGDSSKFELGDSGNYIRFFTKGIEFINEFGHETQIYRVKDLIELDLELTEEAEKLIKGE